MLRGLRWPLLALVAAASLFVAVYLSRQVGVPEVMPQPTASARPVSTGTPATAPAATTVAVSPAAPLPGMTPEPSTDGVVTFSEALVGRVYRLNPLLVGFNPVDADITSLIFEGLTTINEFGEPVGALAENWIIASDGMEYVVTLRSGILWQDGVPFTSADVAFTMALLRSPDFPGPEALGSFWRTVETDVLGEHLIRFRLSQPLGSFLEALRIGILPAHVLQGTAAAALTTHPFNLSPIGTGSYQLEALRVDESGIIRAVDLRVAPVYRQRVEGRTGFALGRVRFVLYDTFESALTALQSGEVDALAGRGRSDRQPLLQSARSGTIKIRNGIEPTIGMLLFNWEDDALPVFREQRVRLALETGLRRDSIIERHLLNVAVRADSPMLPGSWAYQPQLPWPAYSIEQANNLLASARLPQPDATEDPNATPEVTPSGLFAFTILTPDDASLVSVAQEIAAQWGQLNVQVTVEAVDMTAYEARLTAHDFQAALVEISKEGSADPDVYDFWHEGQYPEGRNYGGVNDRDISQLLEDARRDPNNLSRMARYRDFQMEFVRQAIAIPLYYPLYSYALALEVDGVQLGFIGAPADRFLTIREWTKGS